MGVSVYTDKDSYGKGETIRISGEIHSANGMTVSQNIPVTIRITSDTFQKQVATLVTYPSINGNFGVNVPTTNSSWKTSDTYTVNASYGKIQGYSDNAIFSFEVGDNNLLSPLQQSKLGISTDKIECRSSLQLIFKSKNDFPACVKQQTAQTLVKRGWTRPESPIDIIGLNPNYMVGQPINATISYTGWMNGGLYPDVKILNANNGSEVWSNCLYSHTEQAGGGSIGTGIYNVECFNKYPVINESGTYTMVSSVDVNTAKATFDVIQSNTRQTNQTADLVNDKGTITLGNRTYYFETPTYIHNSNFNSSQISFHGVTFTLFPSGFRGGLPIPCHLQGTYQYYWTDVKFADGSHELLHIQVTSPPCATNPIPSMFSNHTNPQAGLIFYDGKMKLLVSIDTDTTNTQILHTTPGVLPLGIHHFNYTAGLYAKVPNWDQKFVCYKYAGYDMQITAEISNAVKFSGMVTDPNGVVHNLIPVSLNSTLKQIYFSASTSDSDGSYSIIFNVVNGSNTSNVNFHCAGTEIVEPEVPPALHPQSP
ncbi:MAG: hypothetical protein KGI27_06210 [Thaumarchaeota archaeon]|nr:hypothetical protein [Nitrososphaerota archaeon]